MNKKTMMIVSGTAGLALGLAACGTETYEYDVSGPVQGQQVGYDCPGEDIAMDAVAFVAGSGKGSSSGGSGKSSKSGSKGKKKDSGKKNEQSKNPSTGTASSGGSAGGTAKPSPVAKTTKNKGVKLNEKPDKPQRLKSLKLPKLESKGKGCKEEYEIFVIKDDYLWEQDVRKADYDKCLSAAVPKGLKNKLFPLCTTG